MDKNFKEVNKLEDRLDDTRKKNMFWLRNALISIIAAAIAFIWFMPKDLYEENKVLSIWSLLLLFFVLFAILYIIVSYLWDIYWTEKVTKKINIAKDQWIIKDWIVKKTISIRIWKVTKIIANVFLWLALLCLFTWIILSIIFFIKEYF
jgi:hypothetical protein